ncbi:MAG TPA: toll/interleukin-1 receptor domain-containing protein [Steroidobacteraceae bacterium]|nr:toll/interleukin-1 receptor domain-containing protein [Steroidobacteraceae bacterium]
MKEHAAATVTPTGPYVFVCYAHDEREIVLEQIAWLRSQGFEVWFDEAIEAGSRWSEDLARAVDGCAVFLYFLSPRSTSSRYCLDEVHFALECGRPIVPVEIAPVTLTPGLKLSIGGTHRIFMHRMPAREFRLKLASGLRAAMQGEPAAHPIESRAAPLRAQATGPVPAMNWRPAAVGIFMALMVFLAMLVLGR